MLFSVAVRSHTLAEMFGIRTDEEHPTKIQFLHKHRPWLVPHCCNPCEVTFEPDLFHKQWRGSSPAEYLMVLFILNVWNHGWAFEKGWTFDMFEAAGRLDSENRAAISVWLRDPIWP